MARDTGEVERGDDADETNQDDEADQDHEADQRDEGNQNDDADTLGEAGGVEFTDDTGSVERSDEHTAEDQVVHDASERDSGTDVHEEEAYDAEEPASEWHVWLAGILVVGGAAILIAPEGMLPELVVGLAPILLLVAVIGFAGQWLYRRSR